MDCTKLLESCSSPNGTPLKLNGFYYGRTNTVFGIAGSANQKSHNHGNNVLVISAHSHPLLVGSCVMHSRFEGIPQKSTNCRKHNIQTTGSRKCSYCVILSLGPHHSDSTFSSCERKPTTFSKRNMYGILEIKYLRTPPNVMPVSPSSIAHDC